MKKAIAILLAMILVVATASFCVSARNLTAEEKDLIELIKQNTDLLGEEEKNSATLIAEAENYLCSRPDPLTPEQIAQIKGEISAARAKVDAEKAANSQGSSENASNQMSTETKKEVLNHIENAAQSVGCKTVVDAKGTLIIKDAKTGEVVVTNNTNLVKVTGFGFERAAVLGLCALTVLCACFAVSKKGNLI